MQTMADLAMERLRFLDAWRRTAEETGRVHGKEIVDLPASEWWAKMASDPKYRSYGTLVYLLEKVHDDLVEQPDKARELAAVVIAFVDDVDTPDPLYREMLRGDSWKERANALKVTGDLRAALDAADRAMTILGSRPSLAHQFAKAELAAAQVLQQMGRSDEAIARARRAAGTFKDHGDETYYWHARMTEAWVLFSRKQTREAMQIFVDRAREAEQNEDMLNLARALHCTGACARELGELAAARDFFSRSLARYAQFGSAVAAEVPKVRWSYALLLSAAEQPDDAVAELERVEAELLRLGMNTDAAIAALDIVRIRFERDEDVTRFCSGLVLRLANAGMAQNAIEALAYVREAARTGQLSHEKLEKVRTYLRELPKKPNLIFLPPPEDAR
jgi:tetratricopeptide (TPR) repeat protein